MYIFRKIRTINKVPSVHLVVHLVDGHLKRFVLHWAKCLLWYPANSATYLQVVINHTILLFVVVVIITIVFFICCQISSVLHNIPAHPRVGRLRRSCFHGDALGDFTPSP